MMEMLCGNGWHAFESFKATCQCGVETRQLASIKGHMGPAKPAPAFHLESDDPSAVPVSALRALENRLDDFISMELEERRITGAQHDLLTDICADLAALCDAAEGT
jgi:hypothetical protein